MKTFYLYDHQGKGSAYRDAMLHGGFSWEMPAEARVIFSDLDMPGRVKPLLENLKTRRSLFFIYPHAARVCLVWDGIIRPSPFTSAVFVSAPGHKQVMELYGLKKTVYVTGWSYCRMLPFMPSTSPRKVLFAPIHPSKRGWLSEINKRINATTFQKLLLLAQKDEIELWVRYIGRPEGNGIWITDGVNYMQGSPDLCHEQIDSADVIVANQTFAYIAVARGKPTVMMAEGAVPHNSASVDDLQYVNSWEEYKHLVMYPHDILDYDNIMALFNKVSKSDDSIREWRESMIGSPFDPKTVVAGVEEHL